MNINLDKSRQLASVTVTEVETKDPSPMNGEIIAWNKVLSRWDTIKQVKYGLDPKVYTVWIRSDGKRFNVTPPSKA